jgi:hypothetical protein
MRLVNFVPIFAACISAMTALPASADVVEARIGEKFQKKLEKDYGLREADVLKASLVKRVERELGKAGSAAARVVLTIEDAQPNRPTFAQVSNKPGLDPIRSISIGGAKVSGVAYDAAGAEIAACSYDWYESDITQVATASTWTDANSVFARFASRCASKLG